MAGVPATFWHNQILVYTCTVVSLKFLGANFCGLCVFCLFVGMYFRGQKFVFVENVNWWGSAIYKNMATTNFNDSTVNVYVFQG